MADDKFDFLLNFLHTLHLVLRVGGPYSRAQGSCFARQRLELPQLVPPKERAMRNRRTLAFALMAIAMMVLAFRVQALCIGCGCAQDRRECLRGAVSFCTDDPIFPSDPIVINEECCTDLFNSCHQCSGGSFICFRFEVANMSATLDYDDALNALVFHEILGEKIEDIEPVAEKARGGEHLTDEDFATIDAVGKFTSSQPIDLRVVLDEFRRATDDCDGEWTPWLNRDRPSGVGDFETIEAHFRRGDACFDPTAIQCRTRDGVDSRSTGEAYRCDLRDGGVCFNQHQRSGRCSDYEVRFCCE